MLRLIEGFDLSKNTDVFKNWANSNITRSLVPGRHYGNAMEMRAKGSGLFYNVMVLPNTFRQGTLGFAYHPIQYDNHMDVMFFWGNKEQYRVSLEKGGNLSISCYDKELARTGVKNFKEDWCYFEICQSNKFSIIIDGDPVFALKKFPEVVFDRVVFSLPENQSSPVKINNLYFDDEVVARGECVVSNVPLSYIPKNIYGLQTVTKIYEINPNTKKPWIYWEVNAIPNSIALISKEVISKPNLEINITVN